MRFMKINKTQAFTLIEILVAVLVITVAILATLSLFSRGAALVSTLRENTVANYALQEQIERVRRTSFADVLTDYPVPTSFNPPGFAFLDSPTGLVTVDYPFGTTSPGNNIVRVTVTVSWRSSGNRLMTKSTATYVTEGGMGD
jgi:prepilin-type N-terminal cleavage/methylation domain-containing protein